MPPRVYIHSPAQEAYHPQITDAHFRTLIQIRGLAYRTGGDHTPPLTLDELVALRGISRRSMCRHLRALRVEGYVRIEPSGANAFVIYPRHWKPGTGLPARPARGRGRLSAMERAALFGEAGQDAAAVSHDGILDHVVVDSHDSLHESHELLLHDHDGAREKNDGEGDGLAHDLAGAMIAQGVEPGAAREKAKRLLAEGLARKRTARRRARARGGSSLARRCELARAGRNGLRTCAAPQVQAVRWGCCTQASGRIGRCRRKGTRRRRGGGTRTRSSRRFLSIDDSLGVKDSVGKLPKPRRPAAANPSTSLRTSAVGLKERSPSGLDFSSKSFVLSA